MRVVDLRSDFLSRPTAAMRRSMDLAAAEQCHFGLREDPHQAALERRAAELLGKEDALLVPTCTMANEIALMLLARPGEVVAAQADAHIVTSEAGAPAALGGLFVASVVGDAVMPPVEAWTAIARRGADELKPRVAAFSIENTHNRGGGAVLTADYTAAICGVAKAHGLSVHLDGSRLFNAAVALGCDPIGLTQDCDTVALSLNKGLGAPVGAILAGSRELIASALVVRQRLGGGFRPTGVIAAAGMIALEDWSHLAADHERAKRLALELSKVPGLSVRADFVETNIVAVKISAAEVAPAQLCQRLAEKGILALPFGSERIRLVTYRDIDDEAIDRAARTIPTCL